MWKYGPIQLLTPLLSFYYFGFIYGILFLIVLVQVAHFVLDKVGYEICRFNDAANLIQEQGTVSNIVGYLKLDKLDMSTFKKQVYSKELFSSRRISQVVVNKYGFYLWKDADVELAKSQVKRCTKNIKDDEAILKH